LARVGVTDAERANIGLHSWKRATPCSYGCEGRV